MKMLLNGKWVDRTRKLEVRDPQDNSLVDTVPLASIEDMKAAIAAAVTGFEYARQMPVHKRMTILNKTVSLICDRHEIFARNIAREGIKTIREARKEVTRVIETMRISAEEARRITGETIPFDQMPGSEGRLGYFSR
jgi:glyceraldehyde-3-phosphate dehydrogenase (NADP+)